MHSEPNRHRRRTRSRHDRKERVLHTRISERLAEDIRVIAEELRVPVSNLVRNVLEEAFTVVESVTDNVGDLVEEVVEEADRAREIFRRRRREHRSSASEASAPRRAGHDADGAGSSSATPRAEFSEVVGWQALILNHPQSCVDCGEPLARGARAFAGMSTSGLSGAYLCGECTDARR